MLLALQIIVYTFSQSTGSFTMNNTDGFQMSDISVIQIFVKLCNLVAAVGAPVFLLPTGVAGSSVDELVQLLWIVYTIIQRAIVLEAAVIFPGQVMKAAKGKANPKIVTEALKKALSME